MQYDKKHSPAAGRYVLLKALGHPVILERVDKAKVRSALREAFDRYHTQGKSHA